MIDRWDANERKALELCGTQLQFTLTLDRNDHSKKKEKEKEKKRKKKKKKKLYYTERTCETWHPRITPLPVTCQCVLICDHNMNLVR